MRRLERPAGLFLCGGGALGSWQSGVLARLVEAGLTFDAVAGFSVGSLNGAGYCYNKTGEMRDIWAGLTPGRLLSVRPGYNNIPLELYSHHGPGVLQTLGFLLQKHISRMYMFSNKPLYAFLDSWLSRSGAGFGRDIKFYVISHAVETRLPYITRFDGAARAQNLSFIDSLVASCAIPSIFPPVEVTERGRTYHLVDGGVIGIANINLNVFEGCKSIVMIGNSRDEDLDFPANGLLGHFESKARRMFALHTLKIYESRVFIRSAPAVHYFRPPEDLDLGILEFDGAKCVRAFDIGSREAEKWLSGGGN
ncbi:MAG TPA: patatin-like phospholipase family protein [Elusimicrobiales bacterium]|nr:patatin-like phospholipase family protein [Elusimicrobiales bacterium]